MTSTVTTLWTTNAPAAPATPQATAVAIAAAISQPWSDVVLSGAVSPAMLHSNLRARELVLEGARPADELPQLCLDADAYWQRRSGLPWR